MEPHSIEECTGGNIVVHIGQGMMASLVVEELEPDHSSWADIVEHNLQGIEVHIVMALGVALQEMLA